MIKTSHFGTMEGGGGLNIEANTSTVKIKGYIQLLAQDRLTPEIIRYSFKKVVKENPEDKFSIFLQLLLHVKHDGILALRDNPELSLLAPSPSLESFGFPPEFFIEMVFDLDLQCEFIGMFKAIRGKDFTIKLVNLICSGLWDAYRTKGLSFNAMKEYIKAFGQLARPQDIMSEYYMLQFEVLIKEFVQTDESDGEENTLSVFLKLMGVFCMKEEDYTGENEIAELNTKYEFDPRGIESSRSFQVFQHLFQDWKLPENMPVAQPVLDIMAALSKDLANKYQQLDKVELLVKENIGVCGYIAELILKKYSSEISPTSYEDLMTLAKQFSCFKPKLTYADWQPSITTFEDFCEKLGKCGMDKLYQADWFEAFFKYQNIFDDECGLKALEEHIVPNADYALADTIVKGAFLFLTEYRTPREIAINDKENKPERVKKLVLSLLRSKGLGERVDEWIQSVYKDGVHSVFAQTGFASELKTILTKMGPMDSETDAKCIAFYKVLLRGLCFQNGMDAIKAMLPITIRTNYFKPLRHVKLFLHLPTPASASLAYPDAAEANAAKNPWPCRNVIDYVLLDMLDSLHHNDPMCEYIAMGLPLLISEDLVPFQIVVDVVQLAMDHCFAKQTYAKLVKLILIYQQLVLYALKNKENFSNARSYLKSLVLLTCAIVSPINYGSVLQARDICMKILETIGGNERDTQPTTKPEQLAKVSLNQLGFLYMRGNEADRKQTVSLLGDPKSKWNDSTIPKVEREEGLIKCLCNWIMNTCTSEWKFLIPFVAKTLSLVPIYSEISLVSLISDTILDASQEPDCRIVYFLKFYGFFITFLQKSKEDGLLEKKDELLLVYETMINLILISDEAGKKGREKKRSREVVQSITQTITQTYHQALVILLDLSDWIITNCPSLEAEFKENILLVLSMVERVFQGRNSSVLPIYRSIVDGICVGRKGMPWSSRVDEAKKEISGEDFSTSTSALVSEKTFEEYVALTAAEEFAANTSNKDGGERVDGRDLYPYKGGRRRGKKQASFKFPIEY